MKQKISEKMIATAYNSVLDDATIDEMTRKVYTVKEAVIMLSGRYFWVPTFLCLKEAKIINEDLTLGDLLIKNGLSISAFMPEKELSDDDQRAEVHFVTHQGVEFLQAIMDQFVRAFENAFSANFDYLPD